MVAKESSIAVVIPTKDRPEQTARAVRSVLPCLNDGDACVVVDNGSADGTAEAARAAGAQVVLEPISGAGRARNRGVSATETEWLAFLDSDDVALPRWLDLFRHQMSPRVGIACCGARYEPSGLLSKPRDLGAAFGGTQGVFLAGTYAVRRALFDAVSGFDPTLSSGQHTDLALRVVAEARLSGVEVRSTDEIGVVVNVHDGARIRSDDAAVLAGTERLLQKHALLLEKDPVMKSSYHATAGLRAVRIGDAARARQHLFEAMRLDPRVESVLRWVISNVGFSFYRSWSTRH